MSVEDTKSSHGKPQQEGSQLLRSGDCWQEHSANLYHQADRPHSGSAQIKWDFISQHQPSDLHLEANKKSVQPPEGWCDSLLVSDNRPSCPAGW